MDKKTIAADIATLNGHFTKFHAHMLPKLGHDVKMTLKNEHDVIVA